MRKLGNDYLIMFSHLLETSNYDVNKCIRSEQSSILYYLQGKTYSKQMHEYFKEAINSSIRFCLLLIYFLMETDDTLLETDSNFIIDENNLYECICRMPDFNTRNMCLYIAKIVEYDMDFLCEIKDFDETDYGKIMLTYSRYSVLINEHLSKQGKRYYFNQKDISKLVKKINESFSE